MMSLSWFVLSIVLINLASNLKCEAVRTDKSFQVIESEFLSVFRGITTKAETRLAVYSEAHNFQKLKDLCKAVVRLDVVAGSSSPVAWFVDAKIIFWTAPQVEINAVLIECPFGSEGVLYIRESAIEENKNHYYVLKKVNNLYEFMYESVISEPF